MSNKTILLVEDNPDDVTLTVKALNKSHISYHIVAVGDGVEALDYLFSTGKYADQQPAGLPALVLLDLSLPRLSGLEVLQRLRGDDRTRHLPVIVLTSSGKEKDLVDSQDLRANGYIRKPVELATFVEAVQELGLFWLLTNERHPPKTVQNK
ncbi:MAG: response regulator [Planctomycetota bacterium]|nr:MAG: response regulator [Planctomycetota bacterium]